MQNDISKEFTLSSLLKFTLPTIIMLVFVATYTIVDGIFVSRFVGTTALSAMNIVFPLINILIGLGIMLGTGGSAIIGKRLGEGKEEKARSAFTLITVFGIAVGLVISVICFLFIKPLSVFLGADENLLPYCVDYGRVMMAFYAVSVVQTMFQTLFITAGKPNLGLWLNVAAGLSNILFDYIFIIRMDMGIVGAAWGTVSGFIIGGIPALFYFAKPRTVLYFVKPTWNGKTIAHTMLNGSSEMVTSGAMAITTFLFNLAMMDMLGEDGVAAITIVLYAQFLFSSAYLGFASGAAPVFSYNYGNQNIPQLKRLFKMCLGIILISSVVCFGFSYLMAVPTIAIFTPRESNTYAITLYGYKIFVWNFLFAGINIFASSFFTALSNGKVSAAISFLRTFVFVAGSILILPKFLGIDGIWLAIPAAEAVTVLIAVFFLAANRKYYHYL
ncbi:MATE family efflux transporter [Anaerotignum sp.]|nr:MATE family efflux transporter [Anaerotignum sp.]MBQ7758873.1 MATE family efflux transporter [Anaerotignum sp.]